ncbi:MAG: SpoIIE family protein phosphatase [Hyphomicrobiaceae bacterium]|nr:SpoIIE family protein phosphatase [Hyphomicrobiaceae bacterium]
MLEFKHASRASQGARPYQEDSAAVWPGDSTVSPSSVPPLPEGTSLIAVLADGMGGHAGGSLASSTICGVFIESFARLGGPGEARLAPSLAAANDAIGAQVRANPALSGMGATLVGAALGTGGLSWISVGDSPMYLFREDELVQLNEDHSLAPVIDRLVAQGRMSAEEARNDPRRHFLRSAVTGEEIELVDAPERPLSLAAGDVVLIASDGIHTLEMDDIRRIISAFCGDGPVAVAEALVRAVDAAGEPHQDNTTVIAITVAAAAQG